MEHGGWKLEIVKPASPIVRSVFNRGVNNGAVGGALAPSPPAQ